MQEIIILILIIGSLLSFTNFGSFLTRQPAAVNPEVVIQEKTIEKPITPATVISPLQQGPALALIDTYITSGPENEEIIEDTNKVVFEFDKRFLSGEIKGKIYFETKLIGFDNDWKKTSSKKRIITVPSGPKEYTFLVRARIKNVIDYTPAQTTFKINVSPYFKKVKISSAKIETSSRPALITLTTNLKNDEKINITGWSIEGKNGKIIIPQGVEKYYHYYNSYSNEDIFIKKGDRIYLSSGYNPLGRDRNFRLNKCLGYLTNSFDFDIAVSKNCPKPTKEEIWHLNPCCQQFILRLRPCQFPDYSENINVRGDKQCIEYINENLNNAGCFKNHSQDSNFLGNAWHIYLNGKDIVANNCYDTLYLRDQNGLIINTYSYGQPVCR